MLRKIYRDASDSKCNHWLQSDSFNTASVSHLPVSQTQRHGADLLGRKSSDEALHLAPDASHQFSHSRAVDAAQVQFFLKTTISQRCDSKFDLNTNVNGRATYFYDPTEFHITDGQLLVSFFGNNLLQHFLQALSKLSLNKGSGSWVAEVRNMLWKME